jgi:CRP/FNR family transcriptional regulator, cyclic AMP receptor protein
MASVQNAELLAASPLFAGLNRNTLKEMAGALTLESWPKDVQLQARDSPTGRFLILVRGRVKITRSNARTGRELTLWLLGPGDGFDVVTLLDGEPHSVSAWTLDEVQTLSAPVSVFREWIERFPALRLAIHRYVARQLRELTDLASDLALHDTMTRLARLLLRHFDTPERGNAARLDLIRNLPQEELATLIGSVRVVVSRLLAELKREAIVELHNGALRVADLKRLLHRADAQIQRTVGRVRRGVRR